MALGAEDSRGVPLTPEAAYNAGLRDGAARKARSYNRELLAQQAYIAELERRLLSLVAQAEALLARARALGYSV